MRPAPVVVVTVRGFSMSPVHEDGDRVVAWRRRTYRRGDAIVFDTPVSHAGTGPQWRLKRVVGVAGDPMPTWVADAATHVPDGHLVVAGDNPRSQDSRHLGLVPVDSVRGRVWESPRRRRLVARSTAAT